MVLLEDCSPGTTTPPVEIDMAAVESLRAFVPVRIRELRVAGTTPQQFMGLARRGALAIGQHGTELMNVRPTTGYNTRKLVIRTWGDALDGLAAAALLADDEGITALGLHFCRFSACPHGPGQDLQDRAENASWAEFERILDDFEGLLDRGE
jgi:hypothetical protein